MPSQPPAVGQIEVIVSDIRKLGSQIEGLIQRFHQITEKLENPDVGTGAYWRHVAFTDALMRLRLFLQQNFNYIETLGVLALARYIFELTVWLKLMVSDDRYGLLYHRQLLEKQLDHYKALKDHLRLETDFFRRLDSEEEAILQKRLQEVLQITDLEVQGAALRQLSDSVEREIDADAARKFTIYAEDARTNGYSFQAHLLEAKVLPRVEEALAGCEERLSRFKESVAIDGFPPKARRDVRNRQSWENLAENAGMKSEYDFIYSYTSRLLHATPVSLTTKQKNLEPDEVRLFLRYIYVRFQDLIAMARELDSESLLRVQ